MVLRDINGITYRPCEQLSIGVLPTKRNVLECMLYLMRPGAPGPQIKVEEASNILARNLTRHWGFANIYTKDWRYVARDITKLYKTAHNNWRYSAKSMKKSEQWKKNMDKFNTGMEELFNIFCTDDAARKKQEEITGIKMRKEEFDFLEDMKSERKMYCDNFVDRTWKKYHERKLKEEKYLIDQRKKNQLRMAEIKELESSYREEVLTEEASETSYADTDYQPEDEHHASPHAKRKRIQISEAIVQEISDMPNQYCHIRKGGKVRPEFYTTVDCLQSKLHMSERQSTGAVIEVGNGMFDRSWKYHNQEDSVIDIDTAPDSRSVRHACKQITVMAYDLIVKEIMKDSSAVVCYMTDGSKGKGVGSFSVQGFMINKKWRPLPQLKITRETRENQAALQKAILKILSEASGENVAKIHERITFKVTDAVAHNINVDEIVALDIGSDHIPPQLFCHVHPVLMFSRKMMEVIEDIEKAMGPEKIYSALLVNATTHHGSVHEQFIDCTMKFISKDYNHKPWNKSNHFDRHINPKINRAKGFRTERFNRYVYCCLAALHHSEDLEDYLLKYDTVTNTLACIIRAFESCTFFKIFSTAVAIMGVHLIQPFLQITYYNPLNYAELDLVIKELYENLSSTPAEKLTDLSRPALSFVAQDKFEASLFHSDMLESLKECISAHKNDVVSVIQLMLKACAKGLEIQRGNVFGFGNYDPESPHLISKHDMSQLIQAPINTIAAEQTVGSSNYERKLRGPHQLAKASASIVKGKNWDLVQSQPPNEFRKYAEKTEAVNSIIVSFSELQEQEEEKGMNKKECETIAGDKRKHKDLEKLVNSEPPGPFIRPEQVDNFLALGLHEKDLVDRLYTEVRYSRDTCLSLPKSSPLFRLMSKYKKLPSTNYAENLKTYLGRVCSRSDATYEDFQNALQKSLESNI